MHKYKCISREAMGSSKMDEQKLGQWCTSPDAVQKKNLKGQWPGNYCNSSIDKKTKTSQQKITDSNHIFKMHCPLYG